MMQCNLAALVLEQLDEPARDIDRPVPPAGTSDGDRQVALTFFFVARQQDPEYGIQMIEKAGKVCVSCNKGADR